MYARPREGLGFVEAEVWTPGSLLWLQGGSDQVLWKYWALPDKADYAAHTAPSCSALRPIPRGNALPTACAPDVTTEARGMYEIPADRSSWSRDPFLKRTAEPRACGVIFGLC